tara:strand:- start:478 stop:1011 length:534 start_codon:yes stop_codon:yes gene_type:complete
MATETIRPNGNANTLWADNAYTKIDDVVTDPSSSGDSTYAMADDDNESAEQTWDFGALSTVSSVASVEVFVRHKDDGITGDPDAAVNVKVGGSWQTGQNISYSGTYSWVSKTWSGSWTASDFDDFEVGITAPNNISRGREYHVAVVYAIATESEIASGNLLPFVQAQQRTEDDAIDL